MTEPPAHGARVGSRPTRSARRHEQESRRVSLIGLKGLLDLWIEHYRRIEDAERQLPPLQPIHFLASSD